MLGGGGGGGEASMRGSFSSKGANASRKNKDGTVNIAWAMLDVSKQTINTSTQHLELFEYPVDLKKEKEMSPANMFLGGDLMLTQVESLRDSELWVRDEKNRGALGSRPFGSA